MLTDQRFGRLVAVEHAGKNSRRQQVWRCICDCGGVKVVAVSDLIDGRVKSCGCLRREAIGIAAGQRWGQLVIISRSGNIKGQTYWNCICICGKATAVKGFRLRSGRTKSCGCMGGRRGRVVNLVGLKIGRLTVLGIAGRDKSRGATWLTKCDCGTLKTIRATHLRRGLVKSCGCLLTEWAKAHIKLISGGAKALWYPSATQAEYDGLMKAKKLLKGLEKYVRQQRNEH